MFLLNWIDGIGVWGAYAPGGRHDVLWAWVTITLSTLVAMGYCAIAVNWYFQTKLADHPHARAALTRLKGIAVACGAAGILFYAVDTPWPVWRAYDLVLAALAAHTWLFVCRTRGGLAQVDERLAQVDELERSAERYREIAELLPHMVWTATAAGAVDFANRRWREYAGDNRTWLDAVHPDDRRTALSRWDAAVAARQPVAIEARLGGRGAYRTFVVRATPIVHGEAVKWLGACADIEDQKLLAAEKEMQARQKSFFLNALSHDLRAPLHNVLLNAHLLKMSAAAHDPADAESVDMILENAVAAGDLVTKLLDFARVGAQDHNDVEPVDVAAVVHQVARRFQPITDQKGLWLRVAGDDRDGGGGGGGASVTVPTDRHKLERILTNLVDNAIKYTNEGGVTLELVVPGDGDGDGADGGRVSIRVTDTGIGIPPETAPFLFDEFYQVNNYERDRSKGFGMGLAICRCLARHLGGDVRLAGTSPGGSCFEFVLGPRGGTAAGAAPAPPAAAPPADVGPDRGGRPLGPDRDHPDPRPAGVRGDRGGHGRRGDGWAGPPPPRLDLVGPDAA